MEQQLFTLGVWKSYDELEENISLDELYGTVKMMDEMRYYDQRFAASLKGVDLDKETGRNKQNEEGESAFDRAQRRANAKLAGIDPDELEKQESGLNEVKESDW